MRRLTIALLLVVLGTSAPARADGFGLGLFLGNPTGLDLKVDLQRRSALDIVIGVYRLDDFRNDTVLNYGHLTYLLTPLYARGRSVNVPLRIGIGGAIFGPSDNLGAGLRLPLELGLMFRTTPLEIYGEVALLFAVINRDASLHGQGGIGLRFYF